VSYRHNARVREYESFDQFRGCSRRDLRALVPVGTRIDVPAGRVLAHQGTHRDEFVVLISGRADVVRDGQVVDQLGAGDHFGEYSLVRGAPHPATVVAAEILVIDVFTVCEFRCAYKAMPAFQATIAETLDRRAASWLTVPTSTGIKPRAFAEC